MDSTKTFKNRNWFLLCGKRQYSSKSGLTRSRFKILLEDTNEK